MNEYNIKIKKIVVNNKDELNSYSTQISKSPIIFELFDCRNREGFFSSERAKNFIDQINKIDPNHYDVVVLDNYEEELLKGELELFRLYIRQSENMNPIVFNNQNGTGTVGVYHAISSPLTGQYLKKNQSVVFNKKNNTSNTCNLEKAILYGGLGLAGLTATVGVGYGIYKGAKKVYDKITNKKVNSLKTQI